MTIYQLLPTRLAALNKPSHFSRPASPASPAFSVLDVIHHLYPHVDNILVVHQGFRERPHPPVHVKAAKEMTSFCVTKGNVFVIRV